MGPIFWISEAFHDALWILSALSTTPSVAPRRGHDSSSSLLELLNAVTVTLRPSCPRIPRTHAPRSLVRIMKTLRVPAHRSSASIRLTSCGPC